MTLAGESCPTLFRPTAAAPHAEARRPRKWLRAPVVALGFVLLVAVFARFDRLAWHFTCADDLLPMTHLYRPGAAHNWQPYAYAKEIATHSTYAPLQYLIYPLLLSPETEYRTMLFVGRLPSAIFSALAVAFTALALWRQSRRCDWSVVLGTSLSAYSLLSVVYAHQMSPYAFGLCGAAALVLVVGWTLESSSCRRRYVLAVLAGILPYASYQLIILSTVALASCAMCDLLSKRSQGRLRTAVPCLATSALLFAAVVAPITFKFIIGMRTRTNFGWQGAEQFLPHFDTAAGFAALSWNAASYLVSRFYYAIANQLAGVDPEAPGLAIWMMPIFALAAWGAVQSARSTQPARRGLGIFIVGTLAVWGVLNLAGRLPLSPTRHTLIFLPLVAHAVGVGASELIARARRTGAAVAVALWATASLAFVWSYSEFQAARRDPFDPQRLTALVEGTRAEAILEYGWTVQHALMFRSGEPAPVVTLPRGWELERLDLLGARPRRLLLVSYFASLPDFAHKGHSLYEALLARGYRITTLIEQRSQTPIETSRMLFNGTNSQFIYLAELVDLQTATQQIGAPRVVP